MDLYEQEKRVGEYYAAIGEVVRNVWRIKDRERLLSMFAEQIGYKFGWHTVAILLKQSSRMHLDSFFRQNKMYSANETVDLSMAEGSLDIIMEAVIRKKAVQSNKTIVSFPVLNAVGEVIHYLAIPLSNRDVLIGVLVISRVETAFDDCEMDILHDLAEHVLLAIDNIQDVEDVVLGKPEQEHGLEQLTPKEKEVLYHITLGESNKEIAEQLFISEKTVKTHISSILGKLELQDRTKAAVHALRNRWFES